MKKQPVNTKGGMTPNKLQRRPEGAKPKPVKTPKIGNDKKGK